MERSLQESLNDHQIYLGYDPSELQALERYRDLQAQASSNFYTDFSGLKTRLSYFGITSGTIDKAVGALPFPDDGVHAEAIEYLAATRAVDAAKNSFTAVELGAGYGPWLAFSGKIAQKRKISKINLIAVEAELSRHELFRTHFSDNALPVPNDQNPTVSDGITVTLIHGAISDTNGEISFGSSGMLDWGAAPIEGEGNVDYRGFHVPTSKIHAYTIDHVIQEISCVDFLHIDIQGFEHRSIAASIDAIKQKVRFMLIATHSRKIEGELFALLFAAGWRILYEKPCRFLHEEASSLESLTQVDGTQFWVNTALVEKIDYLADERDLRLGVAEHRSKVLEKVVENKDFQIISLENELARIKRSPIRRLARLIRNTIK